MAASNQFITEHELMAYCHNRWPDAAEIILNVHHVLVGGNMPSELPTGLVCLSIQGHNILRSFTGSSLEDIHAQLLALPKRGMIFQAT